MATGTKSVNSVATDLKIMQTLNRDAARQQHQFEIINANFKNSLLNKQFLYMENKSIAGIPPLYVSHMYVTDCAKWCEHVPECTSATFQKLYSGNVGQCTLNKSSNFQLVDSPGFTAIVKPAIQNYTNSVNTNNQFRSTLENVLKMGNTAQRKLDQKMMTEGFVEGFEEGFVEGFPNDGTTQPLKKALDLSALKAKSLIASGFVDNLADRNSEISMNTLDGTNNMLKTRWNLMTIFFSMAIVFEICYLIGLPSQWPLLMAFLVAVAVVSATDFLIVLPIVAIVVSVGMKLMGQW